MSDHVDLYHRNAWTGELTLICKADAGFVHDIVLSGAISAHHVTKPHPDGECGRFDPRQSHRTNTGEIPRD